MKPLKPGWFHLFDTSAIWQVVSLSQIHTPLSDDARGPGVTVWLLDLTAPKCQIWHLTGGSILGLNLQFKESVTVRCGLKYNIDTRLDVYSLRIWLMIPIFEHFWNTQVIETCAKVGFFVEFKLDIMHIWTLILFLSKTNDLWWISLTGCFFFHWASPKIF